MTYQYDIARLELSQSMAQSLQVYGDSVNLNEAVLAMRFRRDDERVRVLNALTDALKGIARAHVEVEFQPYELDFCVQHYRSADQRLHITEDDLDVFESLDFGKAIDKPYYLYRCSFRPEFVINDDKRIAVPPHSTYINVMNNDVDNMWFPPRFPIISYRIEILRLGGVMQSLSLLGISERDVEQMIYEIRVRVETGQAQKLST